MKRALPILFASSVLSSCAPTGKVEGDLRRMQSSLNDMRSIQAEQTSQLSAVQQQVRQLTGKMEELEFSQNRRLGTDLTSLKSDLSALKRRVPPPPNVPTAALEDDESMAESLSPPAGTDFSDALLKLREGSYSDALPILQNLLSQGGTESWTPNVLFWISVAYDGMGEPKNALSTYNDLITQFPRHRRGALALVRQASIFQKLGDSKTAELTLKKLVADFPGTPEAQQAKERLGKKS